MKKTLSIMLCAFALLAAPAFADVAITGEFTYGFNTSADAYESVIDTGDLVVTGSTENASVVYGMDFTKVAAGLDDDATNDLMSVDFISDLYMKMDLTGAMGIETPVSVSFKTGRTSFDAQNYLGDIMGYETYDVIDAETATSTFLGFTFNIMDLFNVDYAIDPNLVDGVKEMFAGAYGTFAFVDAEAYYNISEANYDAFGFDFVAHLDGFVPMDKLNFGAGAEYDMDNELTRYGASAGAEMAGFYFGTGLAGFYADAADQLGLGFDTSYAVTEAFKVYGAFMMKDLSDVSSDTTGYEVSASYTFDGAVTAYAGYATAGTGYNALGDLTEDSFFMAVSTAF